MYLLFSITNNIIISCCEVKLQLQITVFENCNHYKVITFGFPITTTLACTSSLSWDVQSFTCAGNKSLEDGSRLNSHQLMMNSVKSLHNFSSMSPAHDELCQFPSQFFLNDVIFRGFFLPCVCWPHAQKIYFFF